MTDDRQLYEMGAIRRLLRAAFTVQQLHRFCRDRPSFRPIVDEFSANPSLADMVDQVVEYCDKQLLLDELLAEVGQVNPRQYARFEGEFRASEIGIPRVGVQAKSAPQIPLVISSPQQIQPVVAPPPQISNELDATIRFDWVTIPAGYFVMGSDKNRDPLAADNEKEQRLYLPEHKIARVPVTVAQFRQYVTAVHAPTTAEDQGKAHDLDLTNPGDPWPWKAGADWEHPHGVGDTTPVPTLDDPKPPRYPPGANGLFDMAGNVWEWTSTLYRASRYNADDGRENQETEGNRVLRGGSFWQDDRRARCANRHWHVPAATVSDIGFRVCAP